jgi:diguanylate cyclase (GGDEF)-like protein
MSIVAEAPRRGGAAADEVSLLTAIIGVQTEIAVARLDLDEIMALVARRAHELTRADGAVVEMAEGADMVYRAASGSAAGHVGVRVVAGSSLSGLCVRTGEILRCDDSETDPRVDLAACRRVGLRSMIVVPLLHDGRSVGVLKVLSAAPSGFGASDAHTLQLLAGLIGAALGQSAERQARQRLMDELERANRRLEELSNTDGLTGLSNRRHFDNALRDAFAQEARRRGVLSLILIDVDHFKSFNDTHGHPAGDEVLRAVGSTLRKDVRAHEVVARYGGEEFAVILPGSAAAASITLATRLRAAVASAPWPLRPITIILGVATTAADTDGPPALLAQADAALYRSKQQGRNRVTHHRDPSN